MRIVDGRGGAQSGAAGDFIAAQRIGA